jgi:hypothetical protein
MTADLKHQTPLTTDEVIDKPLIRKWFTTKNGLVESKVWLERSNLERLAATLAMIAENWAQWSEYYDRAKMHAFIGQAIEIFNEKLAAVSESGTERASQAVTRFLQSIDRLLSSYPQQQQSTTQLSTKVKSYAIDVLLQQSVSLFGSGSDADVFFDRFNPATLFNLLKTLTKQGLLSPEDLANTVESIGLLAQANLFSTQIIDKKSGKLQTFEKDWAKWLRWLEAQLDEMELTPIAASQLLTGLATLAENRDD